MVVASYKYGRRHTAYKNRPVHDIFVLQALANIVAEFDPEAREVGITRLATRLIGMVEAKGLLKGYSAVVSAGACLLAADLAFRRGMLSELGLEALGVYGKAVISAFNVLKGQMYGDGEVVLAILAAGGDTGVFPGQRCTRYYSNLLGDGLLFKIDEDSDEEDEAGGVALTGACKYSVGLGIDFNKGVQPELPRHDPVVKLGTALGNLVI